MSNDGERAGRQSMPDTFKAFQRASIVLDKDLRLGIRIIRCRWVNAVSSGCCRTGLLCALGGFQVLFEASGFGFTCLKDIQVIES